MWKLFQNVAERPSGISVYLFYHPTCLSKVLKKNLSRCSSSNSKGAAKTLLSITAHLHPHRNVSLEFLLDSSHINVCDVRS